MKLSLIIVVALSISLAACDKYTLCECSIAKTNMATGAVTYSDTMLHADKSKGREEGQRECDKSDATKNYISNGDTIIEDINCAYKANVTGVL